jgi:integrase
MTLANARQRCLRLAADLAEGNDPRAMTAVSSLTFDMLADAYLAEHSTIARRTGPGSWNAEVRRILDVGIRPVFGAVPADAVTREMASAAVEAAAKRSSFAIADKTLGIIRTIYRWANGTGRLDRDPTLGLRKRNFGRPRERVLDEHEIARYWHHVIQHPNLSPAIKDTFRLQLLLGLRVGECIGAARNEIDLANGTWTLPARRTKSNRAHVLPLPPLARSILTAAMNRSSGSVWLYPARRDPSRPVRTKSAIRAMARVGQGIELSDATTHDLRRTMATRLGEADVPDAVIQRILNHAPTTIMRRYYNHASQHGAVAKALAGWDAEMSRIIGTREMQSNVVPASRKAA